MCGYRGAISAGEQPQARAARVPRPARRPHAAAAAGRHEAQGLLALLRARVAGRCQYSQVTTRTEPMLKLNLMIVTA